METREFFRLHSARFLYRYIWIGVGIWIIFLVTFGLAYLRVSQQTKFQGAPFQSLSKYETHKPAESY